MSWLYKIGETEHGPVPQDTIMSLYKAGDISQYTRVREDDSLIWSTLEKSDIGKRLGLYREALTDANDRPLKVEPSLVKRPGWRYTVFAISTFVFLVCAFISMIGAALFLAKDAGLLARQPASAVVAVSITAWWLGTACAFTMLFVSYIFYALFMHQVVRNIRLLGATEISFTPVWSWLFHIIPFMCLFKPVQAVDEVHRISHQLSGHSVSGRWHIMFWWINWLAGLVLSRVADSFLSNGLDRGDRASMVAGFSVSLVSDICLIASAVFLLMIFGQINRLQKSLSQIRLADTFD